VNKSVNPREGRQQGVLAKTLIYEAWKQRRLDELEVVYMWADGLYVKAGRCQGRAANHDRRPHGWPEGRAGGGERPAGVESIVGRGAPGAAHPRAEIVALYDCRRPPGYLAAIGEQQPTAAEQRCWNHRITNVLDAIPQKRQAEARTLLCALPYAESHDTCEAL
jgi:putative transposase